MPELFLKRAYEAPAAGDGRRILVERLWPRGLSKAAAAVDVWAKDCAPSTELRRWFGHDPERWDEFQERYAEELRARPEAVAELRALLAEGDATFVYGSRETEFNAAVALARIVSRRG